MTLEQQTLIESFGWKIKDLSSGPFRDPEKRAFFERGNYGLILDSWHHFKDADYAYLWVRDTTKHSDIVGTNDSYLHWSFPWLGEATLHALNTLLPIYTPENEPKPI